MGPCHRAAQAPGPPCLLGQGPGAPRQLTLEAAPLAGHAAALLRTQILQPGRGRGRGCSGATVRAESKLPAVPRSSTPRFALQSTAGKRMCTQAAAAPPATPTFLSKVMLLGQLAGWLPLRLAGCRPWMVNKLLQGGHVLRAGRA